MLRLDGNLVFNGNADNTNSAWIVEDGSQPLRYVGLSGTRTLTIHPGGNDRDLIVLARLQDSGGTGGIVKEGEGTLVLANTCSYTGPTTVDAGRLEINLELTDQTAGIAVNSGGTLGGTGIIGRAVSVAGGTLSPGLGAGVPGIMTLGRNLSFNSGGSAQGALAVELAAANDYGRIAMTGSTAQIDLTDSRLDIVLADGYRPAADTAFTLLDNQGPNPVSGIFEGLPDGARLLVDDRLFSIAYCGGDGNDIVLTAREKGTAFLVR